MKYGAVYITVIAYSAFEMLGLMVLKDYKKIWIPNMDPDAIFPSSKMSLWWFLAAAGLLLNVLYSIALLVGVSFIPYDRKKKVIPFLGFAAAMAVYSGMNFLRVCSAKKATNCDMVVAGIKHLLTPISMVFQTLIPLAFPNSIPSKYY